MSDNHAAHYGRRDFGKGNYRACCRRVCLSCAAWRFILRRLNTFPSGGFWNLRENPYYLAGEDESYIQEAINELVKGKTLLVIAHRLNTIQSANQILVVENGKITQAGKHEALMKEEGTYRNFVEIRQKACAWMV